MIRRRKRFARDIAHRVCFLEEGRIIEDAPPAEPFIDTANGKAPIAQRGKAKQKRADLRLVGLGLVVTRDGGIPLAWRAYPGDKPDVTQFPALIGPGTRHGSAARVSRCSAGRPRRRSP
jgi:hypothetical protein